MDFLNKSFAQLKDLFLSMTPGARITAALLLAVVVVSLGYLFTHEIAGPEVYLLGGEMFSASEINNMAAAFSQEGLDAYEVEGSKIRIPRGQRHKYMAALAKHNALPEDFDNILTRALDAGSAFMSPGEREARQKIGRQKYLSRLLSECPGIERAHVIYGTQKRRGFGRPSVTTASVYVKPVGNNPLDPAVVSSILKTMVKAIPGLKPEDCAVMDMSTMRTTVGSPEDYASPHDNDYIAYKRYHENQYKKDILEALSWIPGVTVTPYVELDTQRKHQEEQVKHDPKPVTVQQSETSSERTVESSSPGGRPGYLAQGNTPTRLTSTTAPVSSETESQTETSLQSLVSTTRTTSETVGLTPKRVAVAVTVPTSYFERVWRQGNPPEDGEQPKEPEPSDLEPIRTQTIERVKDVVATIIPQPEDGTEAKDLVTVEEFPDIAPPELPKPGIAENILVWLGNSWSTLGLIGLALFSLLMLRSMIRAAPAGQIEARTPEAAAAQAHGEEEVPEAEAAGRQLKRFTGSGASLRDELSELVNEDPDTAANILRNWIGTAT